LGGSLYTKTPWNIVASYANHDQPAITDTLKGVHVTKQDTSSKQDDDNTAETKIEFEILEPIEWNGVAAYKEGRDGAVGT
jgi:hypothetical protein